MDDDHISVHSSHSTDTTTSINNIDETVKNDVIGSINPVVANISPKILPGPLSSSNVNAIDWSYNGLIAFAYQNRIAIVEMAKSMRVCQNLHRHNYNVNKIKWEPSNSLRLVSGDTHGNIIVWDVAESSVLSLVVPEKETRTIISIEWIELNNHNKNCKQWYLLVNYSSNNIILYDCEVGEPIWKKNFQNVNLRKFSLDPFCKSNVLFAVENKDSCVFALLTDLNSSKSPNDNIKLYQINGAIIKNFNHSSYIVKQVKSGQNQENNFNNYLEIQFHQSIRDQIYLVFTREIIIFDLLLESIICTVNLEKNCCNLVQVYSCWQRNVFYALHENGSVTLRLYQKQIDFDEQNSTNTMQISYTTLCQSEGIRLIKQNKLYGFAVSPFNETKVALLMNTGKIIIKTLNKVNSETEIIIPFLSDLISVEKYKALNLKKDKNYKFFVTNLLPAVSPPPHVIRMCPPVTLRNWHLHKPLLAIGDSNGSIQIWNLTNSLLEREFSIHSCPVRGIEWTSLNSIISYAHSNIANNNQGKVNNELNLTQIDSGKTVPLRRERNEECSPIEILKISHLKQYFLIAFKNQPFEIWDLKTLTLLKVMPKQFSSVTAAEWSPLYNKRMSERSDTENPENGITNASQINSKENFVTTNSTGELYHFSIEGNIVKEISCIPPETNDTVTVTYVTWKSDKVVIGSADGNINVWDLKKKCSFSESTHRSWIRKIRFGPGRGNKKILILFNDGVDIWDVDEFKLYSQLKTPRDINFKIHDIDWAGSDRPILSTSDGTILITDLKLKRFTSVIEANEIDEIDFENDINLINFNILPEMTSFIYRTKLILNQLKSNNSDPILPQDKLMRYISVAKLFGDKDSFQFWSIIRNVIDNAKFDSNYDFYMDNESFKELQQDKLALYEFVKNSFQQNQKICDLNIFLNNKQRAVQLLLDNQFSNDYYSNGLKACLVSTLQINSNDLSTAFPVIKLVATNLIANGKIDEGAQLLCLIGKTQDACRYLQSANKWNDAVWLAKCTLQDDEYKEILRRYCDHLITQNDIQSALFLLLSLKQFTKAIDLIRKFDIEKACFLIDFCIERDFIEVQQNIHVLQEVINQYLEMLEEAGLEQAKDYFKKLLT